MTFSSGAGNEEIKEGFLEEEALKPSQYKLTRNMHQQPLSKQKAEKEIKISRDRWWDDPGKVRVWVRSENELSEPRKCSQRYSKVELELLPGLGPGFSSRALAHSGTEAFRENQPQSQW